MVPGRTHRAGAGGPRAGHVDRVARNARGVGAGAAVTRDVPARVFAAGSPCRVVKELQRLPPVPGTVASDRHRRTRAP